MAAAARRHRIAPSRASFRLNRNEAPDFCFDAFSSREPGSTSLENALEQSIGAGVQRPIP
ncbi:hypothetical protein FNJ47_15700 [Bradyrhizobium sp. UFLA 03-164]|uniref:Uncharacterized protein n=1 Tax=Bradyrhizobium uaiense TaxID=2594946 RepID=A0A6P1BHX3_9BRAD|nr:hypothetical protein [Bradyrhizobium uaiense]